jgi:hypothetical protein
MSSFDLETRRLLCSERVDQLARDARPPAGSTRRHTRTHIRAALSKLASSPAAYRAYRASLQG